MSGSEDGRVVVWRSAHDWYTPGSAAARITGYSKVKNDSYESFEATEGKVCTATGFLPCVSSPRELAELSAARKLAAGTISRLEYEQVVQMLERDGEGLSLEQTSRSVGGVVGEEFAVAKEKRPFHGIVTVDYEGQLKLFTTAVRAHAQSAVYTGAGAGESIVKREDGSSEEGEEEIDEEDDAPKIPMRPVDLPAALPLPVARTPPALPPKPVAKGHKKKKSTPPSMPPRPNSRINLSNEE